MHLVRKFNQEGADGVNMLEYQQGKEISFQEPHRFKKRVGSTTFHVTVSFSQTSKETANDKIIRLVKNEAAATKEVSQ